MNAIQELKIQLLRSNGEPVCAEAVWSAAEPTISSVHLVQTSTIPGRKGRFVDVVVDGGLDEGAEVLFEPDTAVLKELGLGSSESLLTAGPDGKFLVPLQNYRHSGVDVEGELAVGVVTAAETDRIGHIGGANAELVVDGSVGW